MPKPSRYLERKMPAAVARSTAEWDCVSAQVRERAFFMAGVNEARALQIFRDAASAVAAGRMGAAEARREIRRGLAAMGYDPGAEAGSIHDLSTRRRIDLVVETNERQAQGWRRHAAMLGDPNVGGQELYRLYAREMPRNWVRRWAEAAQAVNWEGVAPGGAMVATLSSPIWRALSRFGLPYPPFDFNSGMSTREVSKERCRALGLMPGPEDDAPPPSLNEEVSASVAGLDADLAQQLEELLGGLVERQGDRLRMADVNGTRACTPQELGRLLARPLPSGVPNLQAKAWAAWMADPDSLRRGGKNEQLLPALRLLARRCKPCPEGLREWLQKNDELSNSAAAGEGVVMNSAPSGHECHAVVRACPYKNKGTTRESDGKKRSPYDAKEKHTQSTRDQKAVAFNKPLTRAECRESLRKQVKSATATPKGKAQGKPGRGAIAPGMNKEFYLTMASISEMLSGKHVLHSADEQSHYTAAANVMTLWEKSEPMNTYRDRKKFYRDSSIEWMHKRRADMRIQGRKYWVEITAKEFKVPEDIPVLYQIKTHRIEE